MKKFYKQFTLVMSTLLLLFGSFSLSVNAAEHSGATKQHLNLNDIKNHEQIFELIHQDPNDIISSYWLDESVKSGVINIFNSSENKYYNLYVEKDHITYYSIQYYVSHDSKDAKFELYSIDSFNNSHHEFTSQVANETGKVSHQINAKSNSNTAYKWACIFSSYVACAAAAGTIGFGVAGPFGAGAAALACRYVFQTLVEKYGSKKAACKIFS
ncbi:hypothetical protein EVJ24_12180 [Exiguobacterium sp. SH1S21]|uniref:hypothetical protein n=1 Tax=unclassified Exiguobacterium TaxID=2644629 RepID=UPI00103EBCB2|nr:MULTISPECIES: hypothetical protein [unclassified Exiguobacterium]TCI51886.1 hypothetical protein EVJ24_12180 [Exiguobacterium sp. SH1S21]TCI69019.1 hypothetical protein EVJ22_11130 [Exiguobacterium sp. SH0S7]